MIAKKPTDADERIVKHAEFASEFDVHSALDMSGRSLSVIQFYNIDVLISMFLIILTILFVLYKLISLILRSLFYKIVKKKRD